MATQTPLGLIKPDRDENYDISVFNQNADRIDELLNKLINITYSELKALRDTSKLVPGRQYRITDYETIINGNVTSGGVTKQLFRSAGHPFDIIVMADSVNTLNENARAIQHTDDTYFASQNLKAWQLKYCLDNDTTRFNWAISSGKGVIFYLKDERDNECGYDFKNIQMKRFRITAVDLTSLDVFSTGTINTKYKTNCIDHLVGTYLGTIKASDLLPVRNDFITINESDFKWVYTFNRTTNDFASCEDASLAYARVNSIKMASGRLNNIAFVNKSNTIVGVHIEINGMDSSFGNHIYGVNIGFGFQNNIIGTNCYLNNIKENYKDNIMIDNCSHNFINGNNHNNIILFSSFQNVYGAGVSNCILSLDNSFIGNAASYIQCGEDCDNWHIDNNCSYIQTGNQCENMFFGNNCGGSVENAIRMGDSNLGHVFLGYNRAITLGNNLEVCLFKNFARVITIANASTTRYGHITLGTGSGNKTFEQGTNYINVANSDIVTRTYTTADNNKVSSNATQTIVNIPISGWTQNSTTGLYSHVISVPGMYPAYVGSKGYDFVRPAKDSNYQTNYDTILEQFNDIEDIESGNNQITVYTYAVPTVAFQLIFYGL